MQIWVISYRNIISCLLPCALQYVRAVFRVPWAFLHLRSLVIYILGIFTYLIYRAFFNHKLINHFCDDTFLAH